MLNNIPQVLFLEDDIPVAKKAKAGIEKLYGGPIAVWHASTLDEACAFLDEQEGVFDAIITDIVMPDGTPGGLELAALAANRLPVIITSAYSTDKYVAKAAKLGPIIFLDKKHKDFTKDLLRELRRAILWKTTEEQLAPEEQDLRSLCLSRQPGSVVAVRFHLADVASPSDPMATTWDFAALAVGFRSWEAAVESRGGHAHVLHDQLLMAAFLDGKEEQDSVVTAYDAFMGAATALRSGGSAVFYRCPFCAVILPGVLVSGMFGRRIPGVAAMVGRLGDWACQIAPKGRSGEVGVVRDWLTGPMRAWFDGLPGTRREEEVFLIGLERPVLVTFLMPETGE